MHWLQFKRFEQRGDLEMQAEGLKKALVNRLAPPVIQEALNLARQSAHQAEQRSPAPIISIENTHIQYTHPYTGDPLQHLDLPKEMGQKPEALINWSHFNGPQVMGLASKGNQWVPQDILQTRDLAHQGLRLNNAYAYLSLNPQVPTQLSAHKSYLCKQWIDARIPLENLKSRPYDLFASPQHPYVIASDRSAGKLHFIQRDPLKAIRSWPMNPPDTKKTLQCVFHPDGKQVYVSSYQGGCFHVIDRAMAQKRIALPTRATVSQLRLSNRGDLLYVLLTQPEGPLEVWVVDTQKHQKQAVFTLEGQAFSSQTDPQDLFEVSPDGRYLLTVVSRNRPNLFSPYLLQIDVRTGEIVYETLLKPEHKPLQFAFTARSLTDPRIRVLPILLHGGHGLEEADVQAAFEKNV